MRPASATAMFGLGTGELVVIFAIVVLIFGASRLPQLGDGMGKALRGFKRAVNEIDEDKAKEERNAEGVKRPPGNDSA